jgi:hypothetical protein
LVNDMVPNYLAQFSWYLVQLQALGNNALSNPTDSTQPQDSGLTPTP